MTTLIVIRIAHIACCILAFGLPAFELFILGPASGRDRPEELHHGDQRMRQACLAACALALVTWLAWLAEVASQMSGQPLAQALHPDVLRTVLLETTFGRVWLTRAGLMIVLAAMLFALGAGAWRRGSWLAVGVIVAGFVLGSLAWTGHALGAHPEHAFIAAIHILAAGLWIGMLVPLLWTLHRAVASVQHDFHRTAAAATRRFTLPGTVAVLALAASGALNAWWLVGSASALVSSGYGLLVTAKITVFVLMLALASTNRWVLLPRLRLDGTAETAAEPLRLLRVSVAFELAFGLSVLVLVGVLGITPPAAHEHANHPMHHTM